MRYQDWDVLLFPNPEEGDTASTHVPLREFRTACYTVQSNATGAATSTVLTPLLTCFVPSLLRHAPFQISVHSWTRRDFLFRPVTECMIPQQMWQIKVIVDGVCASTELYPSDIAWPRVIGASTVGQLDGARQPLQFPPFHKGVMLQSHWDASDEVGRIKVIISEGYGEIKEDKAGFVKLTDHVVFNFQAAPLDILERAGIAWPNPTMFSNPLSSNTSPCRGDPGRFAVSHGHKRNSSTGTGIRSSPLSSMPAPPPPTPTALYNDRILLGQDPNSCYDASSRSTSTYSTIPFSALPSMMHMSPGYPDISAYDRTTRNQFEVRIPSDQLEKILNALESPKRASSQAGSDAKNMPPPPLPLYVAGPKGVGTDQLPVPAHLHSFVDRRGESHSNLSDISMHAACTEFPKCTAEDSDGHIVHSSPAAPAKTVRSRKEGSIDVDNNRDFLSNMLNPNPAPLVQTAETNATTTAEKTNSLLSSSPADGAPKKRTRSTLKSLNLNDGSPEKKDKEPPKPPRKASRGSNKSNSNKENVLEERMVMDT